MFKIENVTAIAVTEIVRWAIKQPEVIEQSKDSFVHWVNLGQMFIDEVELEQKKITKKENRT